MLLQSLTRPLYTSQIQITPNNMSSADDAADADAAADIAIASNKGKRAVKERDKNAPRRNQTAYLLFQQSMKEQYRALHPEMNLGQIAKMTSQDYAEMPQEQKDAWERRAEADRVRYLQELARYIPPPGHDATGNALSEGKNPYCGSFRGPPVRRQDTDPNRPRRNLSAYLLFQNANRERIRKENPAGGISFGQMSKRASQLWERITPEEKEKWEKEAAEDKARYEREMAEYTPPIGYDEKGRNVQAKKTKRKKRRDPAAPKRGVSAYVWFGHEERPKIQQEFPNISFQEVGRKLGERWRAMGAEEKAKYDAKAAIDKERYARESEAYQQEQKRKVHSLQVAANAETTEEATAAAKAAAAATAATAATSTANFMHQFQHHQSQYQGQGHCPELTGVPMFPGTTAAATAAAGAPILNPATTAAPPEDDLKPPFNADSTGS